MQPFFMTAIYDSSLLTFSVCNNIKCGGCYEKAILFTDGRYLQVKVYKKDNPSSLDAMIVISSDGMENLTSTLFLYIELKT